MAQLSEARVPDIGGSTDVPVIEILVKVGDTVRKDQGLVTLESDNATMEVPAPFAGVVTTRNVDAGHYVQPASGGAEPLVNGSQVRAHGVDAQAERDADVFVAVPELQ